VVGVSGAVEVRPGKRASGGLLSLQWAAKAQMFNGAPQLHTAFLEESSKKACVSRTTTCCVYLVEFNTPMILHP